MTFFSSASDPVIATESRTASIAHSTFRPRSSAIDSAKAAVKFSTFSAMTSSWVFRGSSPSSFLDGGRSCPEGMIETGWAAPMLVPGAMAATCPAMVMNVPAEPAQAPRGETNTSTGTSALRMALTMSLVELRRPPGVSSSRTSASAPEVAAPSIPFWM
jgi:hypothetical protein